MSIEMITSDLLVDLSTAEQQIIAGGQYMGEQEDSDGQEEFRGSRKRDKYYCRYCYDCRRSDD